MVPVWIKLDDNHIAETEGDLCSSSLSSVPDAVHFTVMMRIIGPRHSRSSTPVLLSTLVSVLSFIIYVVYPYSAVL